LPTIKDQWLLQEDVVPPNGNESTERLIAS